MSTYLGRTIITMPSSPAPKSVEFTAIDLVAAPTSPFTGQQQIQDWRSGWLEASVTMPPMNENDATAWVDFLKACKGQACVFAIANAQFLARIPSGSVPGGYWGLKSNSRKWSISDGIIYGFQFECREAI
jgi:hypothetical protein